MFDRMLTCRLSIDVSRCDAESLESPRAPWLI